MDKAKKDELELLKKKIANLYEYISSMPYYEYYLDEVNIKKVKGTIQLGHLIEDQQEEYGGVHKIFIDKVTIDEVSGKGVVGVGVTEKKEGKTKKKKIPPEKAPEEIKKIYEEIKKDLKISFIPLFFQEIALKTKVLKKVQDFLIKYKHDILSQYEILKEVNIDGNMLLTNSLKYEEMKICQLLTEAKEAQLKTWILITMLLYHEFDGYDKLEKIKISLDPKELGNLDTSEMILKKLKDMMDIKSFPEPIKKLQDHLSFLEITFMNIMNKQEQFANYLTSLVKKNKEIYIKANEKITEEELSPKQKSFLFNKSKKYLHDLPKFMFIEDIANKICQKNASK